MGRDRRDQFGCRGIGAGMVGGQAVRGKILLSGRFAPGVSTVPLLASLFVHGAVILALFGLGSWKQEEQEMMAPAQPRPVVLVTPIRSAPPPLRRRLRPLPQAQAARPALRQFTVPLRVIAPKNMIETLPAPAMETLPVPVSLPETPRVAAAPPPPLKTDNLSPALVLQRPAVVAAGIQAASFSGPGPAAPDVPRNAPRGRLPIVVAGFGDATIEPAKASSVTVPPVALALAQPIEILFKPHPAYSDEARRLRIEGEVLLEILFTASGEARVIRLVRGLGHGLNENALAAAGAIRFRPAQRAGTTVDSTAIVHIVFQLAY
jgi:TonB family protein